MLSAYRLTALTHSVSPVTMRVTPTNTNTSPGRTVIRPSPTMKITTPGRRCLRRALSSRRALIIRHSVSLLAQRAPLARAFGSDTRCLARHGDYSSSMRKKHLVASGLLVGSLVSAGLVGCGSSTQGGVRLQVTIQIGNGAARQFSLNCEPTSGDMPRKVSLCRMIGAHPQVMLHSTSPGCDGGPTYNHVTVQGTDHGRETTFEGDPVCGPVAYAYAAAVFSPHDLPVVSTRLHCLEAQFGGSVSRCLRTVRRNWKPVRRHA